MHNTDEAFNKPISEGKARIFLKLQEIECEVENNAPDFISVSKDEVILNIRFPESVGVQVFELEEDFDLVLSKNLESEDRVFFKSECEGFWFDIDIEQVKDVWVADLEFMVESKNPRYLAYYIKDLNYQFEWLQPDLSSGDIKVMSVSHKRYKPPKISGKETFTATEVIRCADMLNRAIRKIDLRVGGTYAKFNTEKGRLEPLIIGMADKLGYIVEPLTKEDIQNLDAAGQNVSHSVFLKKAD